MQTVNKLRTERERGSMLIVVMVVMTIVAFSLAGVTQYRRVDGEMRKAVSEFQRRETEMASLTEIVESTCRLAYERRGSTGNQAWKNATVTNLLNTALANVQDEAVITLTRVSGSWPTMPQYPTPQNAVADLSFGTWDKGFNLKKLLDVGPVAEHAPVRLTFTRNNGRDPVVTYGVDVFLWEVPVTNWEFIGYGIPSKTGGVPVAIPTTASSRFPESFWSFGGNALFVAAPDAADPTLKSPVQKIEGNRIITDYYRQDIGVAWNLYSHFWEKNAIMDQYAVGATAVDLVPEVTPTVPGVSYDAVKNVWTVEISATTPRLVLNDYTGGTNIELSTQDGSPPKVLIVRNYGAVPSRIEPVGVGTIPLLLLANSADLALASGEEYPWAVILGPDSAIDGMTSRITGHLSFWATLDPFASGPLYSASGSSFKSAMAAVAPRAVVVKATAKIL